MDAVSGCAASHHETVAGRDEVFWLPNEGEVAASWHGAARGLPRSAARGADREQRPPASRWGTLQRTTHIAKATRRWGRGRIASAYRCGTVPADPRARVNAPSR